MFDVDDATTGVTNIIRDVMKQLTVLDSDVKHILNLQTVLKPIVRCIVRCLFKGTVVKGDANSPDIVIFRSINKVIVISFKVAIMDFESGNEDRSIVSDRDTLYGAFLAGARFSKF
jgi:hypothetical protein